MIRGALTYRPRHTFSGRARDTAKEASGEHAEMETEKDDFIVFWKEPPISRK